MHDARRRAPDGAARAAGPRRARRLGGDRRGHRRRRSPRACARWSPRARSGARAAAACTTTDDARLPDPVLHQRGAGGAGPGPQVDPGRLGRRRPRRPRGRRRALRPGPRAGARGRPRRGRRRTRCASCAGWRSAGPIRRCGRRSPGRHAEVDVFIEWFNRVWKVPPNAIAAELGGRRARRAAPARLQRRSCAAGCTSSRSLLDGRDWLMGETFGAADICAFPFLKYGVLELRADDSDPLPSRARPSTCRSPARSPRSRPGCTASTPFRALEVILRSLLGRVEKACRYCLGERTSQVHLLPEAHDRPAQAGRSLYRATAAAGRRLCAGGPTQIHLCWPAPPSHERGEPVDASRVGGVRCSQRRRGGELARFRLRVALAAAAARGARGSAPPRCGSRAPTRRGSSSRWR